MKENKQICKICGFEGYRLSRGHLPKVHNLIGEEYYIYYILQSYLPPKCLNKKCNNYVIFRDISQGFNNTCSFSCRTKLQLSGSDIGFMKLLDNQEFLDKRQKARKEAVAKSRIDNPEVWKKVAEAVSFSNKKRWKEDLDYRTKMSKLSKELVNNPNSGAGFKNLLNANHPRVGFAKLWEDQEFRRKTTVSIKGYHESIKCGVVPYRSSLELRFMEMLDGNSNVDSYEYEPEGIPYTLEGKPHKYYPDFLITWTNGRQEVIEIKPSSELQTIKNKAKFDSAQFYYEELGIKFNVLTETILTLSDGG